MANYGFPLVAWGTIEDIAGAGWGTIGTATVTGGQADVFGGANASLVANPDGTSNGRVRNFSGTASDGDSWFSVITKYYSAAVSQILWYDVTAATYLTDVRLTWSGGVPTMSIGGGRGDALPPVSLGSGWYLVFCKAPNVVALNSQRIYLRGSLAGGTGSTYYYWQSAVLLDALDDMLPYSPPRDGSEWVRSDAGTADAWLTGQDYRLNCTVCDVPATPQSFPSIVSGWDGYAEIPCVNHGVARMLYVGAQKQTLRFVPDRSNCLSYWDSELVAPLQDVPTLQPNGWRRFPMQLRNLTKRYPAIA